MNKMARQRVFSEVLVKLISAYKDVECLLEEEQEMLKNVEEYFPGSERNKELDKTTLELAGCIGLLHETIFSLKRIQ